MDIATIGKSLGKDEFLKLFTNQLKYQDPLKPMESTEFTAQLAQFSSLEQLYNMNDNLQKMGDAQKSLNNASAAGLIGRHVMMQDGTSGTVAGISFEDGVTKLTLDNGASGSLNTVKEIN